MEETIKLKCTQCGTDYEKPMNYKVWNKEHPNVFFKWNLMFCDKCRKEKEEEGFKRLPEIIRRINDIL